MSTQDVMSKHLRDLVRVDLDFDDVMDDAHWAHLPYERVQELTCRYCGDDAATRSRLQLAVRAARDDVLHSAAWASVT